MASKRRRCIFALILIAIILPLVLSNRNPKFATVQYVNKIHDQYKEGDYIPLLANIVRPAKKSCEAYPYFELPFCPPGDPITGRKKSFKEVLAGDCFNNTLYELKFKVDTLEKLLCKKNLTKDEVAKFRYAVLNEFEYIMYYNKYSLLGHVGIVERKVEYASPRYYILKHIHFYLYYWRNQVKDITLVDVTRGAETADAVDITEDAEIEVNFTYSATWKELNVSEDDLKYWDESSSDSWWPTQGWEFDLLLIRWAIIIIIWVAFLLAVTVPYLRNYFTRYSRATDYWELNLFFGIHDGITCKCPAFSSLLGSFIGIGSQILIMICTFFALVYKGKLNSCNQDAMLILLFLTYCLTSSVSGYIATSFHTKFSTVGWKECIFQTGVLFIVPAMSIFVFVNGIAVIAYGVSDIPDLDNAVSVFFKWGLVTFLLLCLGGKIAYLSRPKRQQSCATKLFQMHMSQQPWFLRTSSQMIIGGLLPFTAIFLQIDDIYASLWNLKVCGAFRTMVTSSSVVVIVTILVGMSFTRYQLSRKDYNWWWRSVLRGGSPAIFFFVYGIYFHTRSRTEGFMILFLFMGYNACICYAFFLALGTIGFHASSFVFNRMHRGLLKYD